MTRICTEVTTDHHSFLFVFLFSVLLNEAPEIIINLPQNIVTEGCVHANFAQLSMLV